VCRRCARRVGGFDVIAEKGISAPPPTTTIRFRKNVNNNTYTIIIIIIIYGTSIGRIAAEVFHIFTCRVVRYIIMYIFLIFWFIIILCIMYIRISCFSYDLTSVCRLMCCTIHANSVRDRCRHRPRSTDLDERTRVINR